MTWGLGWWTHIQYIEDVLQNCSPETCITYYHCHPNKLSKKEQNKKNQEGSVT